MIPASIQTRVRLCAAAAAAVLLTGCGMNLATTTNDVPSGTPAAGRIHGSIQGGQQPVSGSTIQLYAVTTAGYGAPAAALLTVPVMSAADGSFSITQSYSCTGVDQVYLVAMGGNPGLPGNANNAALAMMAALGSCSSLLANSNSTFINLNEVTTVAGAWSLAQFMSSPTSASTSTTNTSGVQNAFLTANKIANTATGAAPGPTLPAGAALPVAEVNTLANILSSCINSNGSTGASTACGALFAAATPPGGPAPTDTLTAALNIAKNPANSVPALFALAAPSAVFQPTLSAAPSNWLIGIHHAGGGLAQPTGVAVDATGNVWVSNAANSVSEFSPVGSPLSPAAGFTSGSLSNPSAIALDVSGNAWVANLTGSVTRIAPLGVSATNFSAGGFNLPSSVAIDGAGNVWVANSGNGTVSGLTNSGSTIAGTPFSGAGITTPGGIAMSAR
jgi:hypothetical protein